ncbi:MAG: PTS sugar transporter subunit IIC [Lachnospiraceae bacterium]|nr:PTS sugar transporter subunit IIC [Lachnospiraceae bacterium]
MAEETKKTEKEPGKVKVFLKKKGIEITWRRYLIDAMGAMASGLFASLLVGTIIGTLGTQLGIQVLIDIGGYAKSVAGPAMAVAIAYALKAPNLVLFSMLAVGAASNSLGGAGGPLAVLIIAIVATEFGKLVSKETKIDILVTPIVTIGVGVALAIAIAPWIGSAASSVGKIIMWATDQQPFVMGILVSVIVGIALTLPISSAAICAALALTGLAGGAAVAGCCAQMVGFAVMSFKENKWGGLVSQGIGTSMLQMGNIVKNPRIWIPPILTSAITGPIATCVFQMKMNGEAIASGMGTCGLVGQIGVYTGWVNDIAAGTKDAITGFDWAGLVLICFILPAVLTWVFGLILRKIGWIKENDLKLDV